MIVNTTYTFSKINDTFAKKNNHAFILCVQYVINFVHFQAALIFTFPKKESVEIKSHFYVIIS